ncbi:MAG: hypothetical protein FJX83_02435 [Bacteroidetes bacterium]|nr:hypothetical protein [Bacteroidota bacterium]
MTFLRSHLTVLFGCFFLITVAQPNSIVHEGELGFSIGGAHYFGDLNNRTALNSPKPSAGIFFRKQFGNHVALRLSGHIARLGYADGYNTNYYQRQRNLSFNTTITEAALRGDFNFFKFIPGSPYYRFTPYFTLGVGTFSFDPYALIDEDPTKHRLRDLRTEGQAEPYARQALCFPVGLGLKYNLRNNINIGVEVTHRNTTTDYLDDVSTVYAGDDIFLPGTPAYILQDRSLTLPRLGVKGKQRGFSPQKDQYIFAEVSVSFSFTSYKCADPR